MNWLSLIALLYQNRDKIEAVVRDLIKLIQDLRGETFVAMTEASVQGYELEYSALAEFLQSRNLRLIEIIRLIIENKDLIQELIEFIREITRPSE